MNARLQRIAIVVLASTFVASLGEADDVARRDPFTNSIGMTLVWAPPGACKIGSPTSEPGRGDNEQQSEIRFSRGFYLSQCEVTQRQFEQVTGRNPSAFSRTGDRRKAVAGLDTSNFPVESITWANAVEFCRQLSELPDEKHAGRKYRLPTEAEWEYACRAGEATSWSFGDDVAQLADYAWYGRQASGNRPHPVATKKPNRWGLYDMHGNAWEWCGDIDMADEHARFLRGGSWFSVAANTRSAARRDDPADVTDPDTGFRVVLEP